MGSPPASSPSPPHGPSGATPLFSAQEIEALRQDRRRAVIYTYLTAGVPLQQTYDGHQRTDVPQACPSAEVDSQVMFRSY